MRIGIVVFRLGGGHQSSVPETHELSLSKLVNLGFLFAANCKHFEAMADCVAQLDEERFFRIGGNFHCRKTLSLSVVRVLDATVVLRVTVACP
jgi:hypothetical protein